MNRRARKTALLLASAALASLPGAARAELPVQMRIYGFLNAEVERVSATGGATPYGARWRVTDGNSRLGFSGELELGRAFQGLWQLEGGLNNFEQGGVNDKGISAVLVSRNTFVGVQHGRWGRLVLGFNDSVYRSLVGSGGALGGNLGLSSLGLDLWNNTSAQVSGNPDSVFSRGEARFKNSIHYLSPDWLVRVGGSYGFDEAVANGRSRDRLSVAARLAWKGIQLGAGVDRQGNTGANPDALEQGLGLRVDAQPEVATYFVKAVASYTAPTGTYVGVGWERSSYGLAQLIPASPENPYTSVRTGTMQQDGAMASVAQSFGGLSLMASYGKLFQLEGSPFFPGGDYQATQLSVGAKYVLSDHFVAYAYFTAIENETQQNANLGQGPIYSNAAGTPDAYLAPGNDPRAAGAGFLARF
jgi:predicted porin